MTAGAALSEEFMPSWLRLVIHDPTEAGTVLRCIMNQRCKMELAFWLGRVITSKEWVAGSVSLVRVVETAEQGLWQGGCRCPRQPGGVLQPPVSLPLDSHWRFNVLPVVQGSSSPRGPGTAS